MRHDVRKVPVLVHVLAQKFLKLHGLWSSFEQLFLNHDMDVQIAKPVQGGELCTIFVVSIRVASNTDWETL